MKRPAMHDALICTVAAEEWVENNVDHLMAEDYFLSPLGQGSFAKTLGEALQRNPYDAHSLARYAKLGTDADTLEDMEGLLAHLRNVYSKTMRQWKTGWPPTRPFEGVYGRVSFALKDTKVYSGIAKIEASEEQDATLHVYLDSNKDDSKIMNSRFGFFGSARIVNWEDVTEAIELTQTDLSMIADHEALVAQFDRESKANNALHRAKQKLSADIKVHSKIDIERVNEIFGGLNISDDDIPLIISVLNKIGVQKRLDVDSEIAPLATSLI